MAQKNAPRSVQLLTQRTQKNDTSEGKRSSDFELCIGILKPHGTTWNDIHFDHWCLLSFDLSKANRLKKSAQNINVQFLFKKIIENIRSKTTDF